MENRDWGQGALGVKLTEPARLETEIKTTEGGGSANSGAPG